MVDIKDDDERINVRWHYTCQNSQATINNVTSRERGTNSIILGDLKLTTLFVIGQAQSRVQIIISLDSNNNK